MSNIKISNIKKEWLGNVKGDLIAGIVVCMALIPEAIGFSIVAGVDPMIGVYASFTLSLVTVAACKLVVVACGI